MTTQISRNDKVTKEINKSYLKSEILDFINTKLLQIGQKYHQQFLDCIPVLLTNLNDENYQKCFWDILSATTVINSLVTDAYTLARIFKQFDTTKAKAVNPTSNNHQPMIPHNIIIYGGNGHAKIYREFLSSIGSIEVAQTYNEVKAKNCVNLENFPMPFFNKFPIIDSDNIPIIKNVKFDPEVVLQFYSKSTGKPAPGEGVGEKITAEKRANYTELGKIPDWRKILSNFYLVKVPFELDGKHWASVEHFYQASKFKQNNPDFYDKFSVDSNSKLSQDPVMAKSAGGKTGKMKGKLIRPLNIKLDHDFFSSNKNEKAMFRAQMTKYISDQHAREVLLATNDAKLTHFIRGDEPIVFYDSMKIREILRNK